MNKYPKMPPPSLGYFFPVLFATYEIFNSRQPNDQYIYLAIVLLAFTYYSWIVYLLHKVLQVRFQGHYPISPKKALVNNLIPIYNGYWHYKWPHELFSFLDTKLGKPYFNERMIRALMYGGLLLMRFDFAIGFAVTWGGLSIILKGVIRLSELEQLPTVNQSSYLTQTWSEQQRNALSIPESKR